MRILKRIITSGIFRSLLALVLLYWIIRRFDIDIAELFANIKSFQYIFAVIVVTLFVTPLLTNTRWKIFLEYTGIDARLIDLIVISFKSIFYSIMLPSGQAADGFRIYAIEKLNPQKRGFSGGTVIADRMIGFIVFTLLASAGSFFLPDEPQLIKIKWIIIVFTAFLIGFSLFIISNRIYTLFSKILGKIKFLRSVFGYIDQLHLGLTKIPYRKILPRVFPLVLIFQLSNILMAHLIFLAFDVDIPFYYHLALVPVIQVLTILPVSIANIGFREGLFIYFYAMIDVPENIAFSVSLIYLLLTGILSALVGGALVFIDGLREKKT